MDKEFSIKKQEYQMIKKGFEEISKAIKDSQKVEIKGAELITIKGEKGDEPTKERLEEIIKPLIPTKDKLIEIIKPLIPPPLNGLDGQDYILTSEDKEDIASRINVPVVEKIIEKTERIVEKPTITEIIREVAVKDTPEEIENKILSLEKSWIPIDMIKGDFNTKVRPPIVVPGSRPLDLFINWVNYGIVRELNIIGSGVSVSNVNGMATVSITGGGGGGGGFSIETPTGSVNGSNVTFTVTQTPVYIVADGTTYFDGAGYTTAGLTVTMTVAPTSFIRNFYAGSGTTVETPTGTVNGTNAVFTVTSTPDYIISDGATYFDGAGYTIVGLTVTMTVPPSSFIRSFY